VKIEFYLKGEDEEEINLMTDFLKQIVFDIKIEIFNNVVPDKMQSKEQDILNVPWINWIKKPENLNVNMLVNLIINSIKFVERKDHSYIIAINPSIRIPNSSTPISMLARFLDKGNDITPGTFFITKIFNEYRDNMAKYWDDYISYELNKQKVNNQVIIII